MLAFLEENYGAILTVGLVAAAVLFTICIVRRLIHLAVGIAVLSVIIPILFTIFWGDGSAYVSELASCLAPKHRQQLEDVYAYYRSKDAENPVMDYDAVSNKITDVFSAAKEKEREITDTTKKYAQGYAEELFGKAPRFQEHTAGSGP